MSKNLIPLFVLVAFAACSQKNREQPKTETRVTIAETKTDSKPLILFFPKSDATGVVKMRLQVDDQGKNTTEVMVQIIEGLSKPLDNSQSAVFPQKTDLFGTFTDKDILYLDFSSVVQKAVFPNIQMEQLALEAFLSTIKANFPNIQQIKFLAEHEDTQTVFGHTYAQLPFNLKDF